MSAIAKPDNRDLSVTDLPFNWNARLDIRKLRVGYLKDAFDETRDPVAKANEAKALEQMEKLGFKLKELTVPEWSVDVSAIGVESAVFFDDLVRSGRDKQLTNPGRANGFRSSRVTPAVEYLQSQRARMMMMVKLAEATADVDVYLAPFSAGGGPPRGGTPPTDGAASAAARDGSAPRDGAGANGTRGGRGRGGRAGGGGFNARRSAVQRHFTMANLACYPAVSVPNGFSESGSPSALTFYARPYGEAELLAVVKAYQDASGFHLKHPKLEGLTQTGTGAL